MIIEAVAAFLSLVIAWRCVRVIFHMHLMQDLIKRGVRIYLLHMAFGSCYALLCIASVGATLHIIETGVLSGDWIWLIASAGLIIFDRRTRRSHDDV